MNRELHGLCLADDLKTLPAKSDKLFHGDKEVGYITSAIHSPRFAANLALGYVRRETNKVGTELTIKAGADYGRARISEPPFEK
ncbi:MAG: glycine cleavage T C-terminal barrel domain-containing protein [Verrucomicrobiota bacterium]